MKPKELILRINNILNKTKFENSKRVIEFGSIKIDLNKLFIYRNQQSLKINNTEKIILEKMINSPGKIFQRDEIGALIDLTKERSIDVIITRLRKKIEENPKAQNIFKQLEEKDMFYGLSKLLKNLLPKRLFYRGLLIVVIPIFGSSSNNNLVFFDSLWIKTNKGLLSLW